MVMGFAMMSVALLQRGRGEPRVAAPLAVAVPVTMVATTPEVDPSPQPAEPMLRPTPAAPTVRTPAARPVAPPASQTGDGQDIEREAQVVHANADIGSGDSTGGEGQVDPNAVARIIRGQIGGIRGCYERELHNRPTLAGRLEMNFIIGPSGRITHISAGGPLASSAPAVGSCVASRLRGLVFPTPEGGSVEFSFPFTFTPRG